MLKIWLPKRLYQVLPLAYLLAGLLMLAKLGGEPLGRLSGAMLCAAGGLVLVLRLYGASKSAAPRDRGK
jgi:hypothetical protein